MPNKIAGQQQYRSTALLCGLARMAVGWLYDISLFKGFICCAADSVRMRQTEQAPFVGVILQVRAVRKAPESSVG